MLIRRILKTQMSIPLTAFSAEVPSELIQLYGDWSSDAYRKYLRFKLDDKKYFFFF
jgi:hypothetical protein